MTMRRLSSHQQRAQHPEPTFKFPTPRFSRFVFSFRFKAIKRLRHVQRHSPIRPKPQHSVVTIAKRKRSKYGHVPPPPSLATDLAVMQFTGGGNIETHIKQIMEKQAKAAGGSKGTIVGIADVYRDSNGGIWWDADEEVEYAHLLDGIDRIKAEDDAEEALWEDFDESPKNWYQTHCRRSSTESTSSADSDLDPKYLFPAPEVDSYPSFTSGELNDRVLVSTWVGGEIMNALSLPPRPSRQARHLLRPVSLVDLHAFGKPKHRHSSSLSSQISSDRNSPRAQADHKPKKANRRRVLPLNLNSAHVQPSNLRNVPASAPAGTAYFETDATRCARIQFVKDSFSPSPSISSTLPAGKFHRRSSSISSKSSFKKSPKKTTKHSFFSIRAVFRKRSR